MSFDLGSFALGFGAAVLAGAVVYAPFWLLRKIAEGMD